MHGKRIILACAYCGQAFPVEPYRAAAARFCSRRCTARGRRPPRRYPTPEERLWARVEKGPECWLWTAPTDTKGYGQLRVGGRLVMAHRLSWELANGAIPEGLCVLHRCDVAACVNPGHLFLGTKGDNNTDRHRKGRTVVPRGPRRR